MKSLLLALYYTTLVNHIILQMQKYAFCVTILAVMRRGTNMQVELSLRSGINDIPAPDNDAALVLSSQKGDMAAFESLVVRHQKRMLNVAFRLIGDYDEACEVVQDAFVSAYKNIRTFRGEAKFTTWLTTITMNFSRNRLKQMSSRQSHVSYSLDEPRRTEGGEMTVDPPSKEPSALDQLEKRDVQGRVQDCVKALEPEYREVIILRDLQGFSYDEIGSMLKMREGTVKSRLFRAREAARDCLKKAWGEL
jgi:RNA polymerase sigma-70 factor (ECF subfamily)